MFQTQSYETLKHAKHHKKENLLDFGSSGDVEAGKRDDPESGAILRCFEVVETETLEDKPPPPPVPRSQTTTAQLQ